ncbi:MAG: glycogen debranching enzyme N-terminal domain-containing protein, partial [Prevotella sp.]|nr:glycogen debranching enzyme N-terminal domain-containing protein [Prevotella sp.]
MSSLKFEKAVMTNLQESLRRELLRTNRSGAYSSSTIVDCNTRKYHGLLVVPVPEIDDENHVLLSSLDATVVQHGAEFNLGLHKYQGNNYSPNGHKYIREFDITIVPTTTYRVGGAVLKRETIFQAYEDRILVRYTLVEANAPTTLRLRPFLAFRSVRQFTHENSTASREYHEVPGGIRTCMYQGYPNLYMQLSKKNQFVFMPDWYRGIEYPKEQERGYASNEDLYVPGYFEVEMKRGDSFVFAAGTKEVGVRTLQKLFEEEISYRT